MKNQGKTMDQILNELAPQDKDETQIELNQIRDKHGINTLAVGTPQNNLPFASSMTNDD
jgi:hypothetical protein